MRTEDTIFALSSGAGRAGIAIVRVSGSKAFACVQSLAGDVPAERRVTNATLRDGRTGEALDRALLICFAKPRSFTGEDVAEFHVHGSPAVVAGLLDALGSMAGVRPAEPGEFTRRAFEAGKMDLAETEALADLLASETAAQRRQALRGLEGGIGRLAEGWRTQLIEAMALIEADIDFPDEGDVPTGLVERARDVAHGLLGNLRDVIALPGGERLRTGATIVIAGPPNAGKSTFLNRVAQREVAIVTPHAGTTRDMIEVALDLDGYPAVLIDTAGFRATSDPVEREALNRARGRAASADLVLWFRDSSAIDSQPDRLLSDAPIWEVTNKIDLARSSADGFNISAQTGAGVADLLDALTGWVKTNFASAENAIVTHQRHRLALAEAGSALDRAISLKESDLIGEELRLAASALGRISGRVDVEDLLDVVFGTFCIGK
ncbi:tRNA uridine-5-carboxymethylaminomethyl(34) synthesis GTPase MnmE [Terrihabitans sp. B22-R8]|uniref:tRNA uridine-5-carboxymethylaminomethyl(34) synthesis GTPase MnmE n=1 Tax=Terrihabitans sp. B22-R8 TaxID=3425128 RepID=UPI00403C9ACD